MIATPASAERVQKGVFNFEIYRFLKKRPIYPILPYWVWAIQTIRDPAGHGHFLGLSVHSPSFGNTGGGGSLSTPRPVRGIRTALPVPRLCPPVVWASGHHDIQAMIMPWS